MSALDAMVEWYRSPLTFARDVLGATPDEWQVEVLDAVTHHQRLALKASKGPGKSTVLAWIAWWFLCTRPHPKVVATSITEDNLRDNLWAEMAKWQHQSEMLKQRFTWGAERIVENEHPETWFMSARTWPKTADVQQQANTLAGIHADHVLFLIDEAGGIPDAVVAAAEGGLANADDSEGREALLILAGNPTHLEGPLYRACTRERPLWWVKEISGDPDDPKRAPRVSIQWARAQIEKYGRDNPWVLVNVFGRFPPASLNSLLGIDEVTDAARRSIGNRDFIEEPKVLGVDVARFGDDRTVLQARQGRAAFKPDTYRNLDTMEVAAMVIEKIRRWQPDAVFIDMTGIGAGVVDRCKQLGADVIGVDFGSKPLEGRYLNRRSEMWWKAAEWVKAGGCISDDPELVSELVAPRYSFDSAGKMVLESKKDMKARGLPSPDKADALVLTFASPVLHKQTRQAMESHGPVTKHEYDPYGSGAM